MTVTIALRATVVKEVLGGVVGEDEGGARGKEHRQTPCLGIHDGPASRFELSERGYSFLTSRQVHSSLPCCLNRK
ncbi:MAG: hypothetical protein M3Q82_01560 [Actinomycetota bacterium]|nr:hypothetical protein [Actinomycetota bacterium]